MNDTIYAPLIRDMTWSYSRVKTFENCPHKFYLRYILQRQPDRMFFSDYGNLMHRLLEQYYKGELRRSDLPAEYLARFSDEIQGKPMTPKVFSNYFADGLRYLREFVPVEGGVVKAEGQIDGEIEGIQFTGVIDLSVDDGEDLMIIDHKSRALKPRSNRAKPTQNDLEIDEMLTQLYLYAPLVQKTYWRMPKWLCFNCFRTGTFIKEPFDGQKYEEAKSWLCKSVDRIANEREFDPDPEPFKCNNLCEMRGHCAYADLI